MSDDPLYTYEDIELYAPIKYRGVPGYVVDKGQNIIPQTPRKMIRVSLDRPPEGGEGTDYIMGRDTVNNHLERQSVLWVDFEWALTGE